MVCLATLMKKGILKRNIPLIRYCIKQGVDLERSYVPILFLDRPITFPSYAVDIYVYRWIEPNSHSIAFKMLDLVFQNTKNFFDTFGSGDSAFDRLHYHYNYPYNASFGIPVGLQSAAELQEQRMQHILRGLNLLHSYVGYDVKCSCC